MLNFLLLNMLIKYYKISKKINNNKDKSFIFNYGKIIISLLKTRLKLLTTHLIK